MSHEFARKIGKAIGTAQFITEQVKRKAIPSAIALASHFSPFGCGTTLTSLEIHDHKILTDTPTSPNGKYVLAGTLEAPYNPKQHGEIDPKNWLDEGGQIILVDGTLMKNISGKPAIHKHKHFDGNNGIYEYKYE